MISNDSAIFRTILYFVKVYNNPYAIRRGHIFAVEHGRIVRTIGRGFERFDKAMEYRHEQHKKTWPCTNAPPNSPPLPP